MVVLLPHCEIENSMRCDCAVTALMTRASVLPMKDLKKTTATEMIPNARKQRILKAERA